MAGPVAPPFTEKTLANGTKVFYNPTNVEVDIPDERFHARYLDYRTVFRWSKLNGTHVKKIEFDDLGSHSNRVIRQRFFRWAKRGKYDYICLLNYTVKEPQGRVMHRLTAVAAYDYGHYLKLQNGLFEFMALYQLSGDVPLKGE